MSALLARLAQARAVQQAQVRRAAQSGSATFRRSIVSTPIMGDATRSLATLSGRQVDTGPVAVLDLETTGLHGAGTVPFVIGIAIATAEGVDVLQWTLESMGGEHAMLVDVLETLDRRAPRHLLTFNGSSFDRPLLQRRLGRYRLASDPLMLPHTDVLVVARRLLQGRFEDCRLATLESELLGVRRRGDIPSAEIPSVFFEWLRAPQSPRARQRLARVVEHNRRDVLSTLGLLSPLAAAVRDPGDDWEAIRVARHFLREDEPAQALSALARFEPARWTATPAGVSGITGAHLLAEVRRALGQAELAAEVWHAIARECPGDPVAHERLAKHYEHRRDDPGAALRYATQSSAACSHRIERLRRKVTARAV